MICVSSFGNQFLPCKGCELISFFGGGGDFFFSSLEHSDIETVNDTGIKLDLVFC